MADETPTLLDPADAARLTEFARACKAAARAVVLYPAGHPAIVATLGRIVQMTSASTLPSPMRITVLAHGLQVDGRSPARPDASLGELATLLHDHLIGEITIKAGGDMDAWRQFLLDGLGPAAADGRGLSSTIPATSICGKRMRAARFGVPSPRRWIRGNSVSTR